MINWPSGISTRSASRSSRCGSLVNSSVCGITSRSTLCASNGRSSRSHQTALRPSGACKPRFADGSDATPGRGDPPADTCRARSRRSRHRARARDTACGSRATRRAAAGRVAARGSRRCRTPRGRAAPVPSRARSVQARVGPGGPVYNRSVRHVRNAVEELAMKTLEYVPVPAFEDNYIWLVSDGSDAVVVDPGDAAPVRSLSRETRLAADRYFTHAPSSRPRRRRGRSAR